MRRCFFFAAWTMLSLLLACGQEAAQTDTTDDTIHIVATTSQIGDIAKNVGGEHAEVNTLMGPGVDPHLYQATQQDMNTLSEADIIFYNGHHLEGNLQEIFHEMSNTTPVYAVAENTPRDLLLSEENSDAVDPHLWFDPNRWKYAVEAVQDGLVALDANNKDAYAENTQEYIEMLEELDTYAKEQLAAVSPESRVLVTAHDAFGYFGDAYDFDVEGLQGLSTDAEYSVRDVNHLVRLLTNRNIKAVFVESSVSERAVNAVIEGARKEGHEVEIGGELYSDAMGEEGTDEGTYEGMFISNIDTIVSSLQ
ncbi:manganese/zinc/iron transport system substrate-binding protein [Alteribacillus persepolensis]|uniref:Manganese/zinc/iron transport system substrate-binding protein n=1 Tax=Alteribacillus persepolensis TaxID=568899 RepID=A0A1G8FKG2_9BACI|nr:zinc ABC transporter substrate-binding protein [Alteribacillus persepolensis]SDH82630.1 manganese/zinc/iron transport system substrate-binding protein [Alteribacillus persepolensis]